MFHNKYRPAASAKQHNQQRKKYQRGDDKVDDADLSSSRTPRPRETWQTIHLRDQHSQQNTTPTVSIGPYGHFLFGQAPLRPLPPSATDPRPTLPTKACDHTPRPLDVITTASVTWKQNKSHNFFWETPTLHQCQESTRSPASVR